MKLMTEKINGNVTHTQMFPHGCRDLHTWDRTTGSSHSCSSGHLCPHCHCLHLSHLMEAPWRKTAARWWWCLVDAQPAACGPSLHFATLVNTKCLKVQVFSQNYSHYKAILKYMYQIYMICYTIHSHWKDFLKIETKQQDNCQWESRK